MSDSEGMRFILAFVTFFPALVLPKGFFVLLPAVSALTLPTVFLLVVLVAFLVSFLTANPAVGFFFGLEESVIDVFFEDGFFISSLNFNFEMRIP